MLVHSIIKPNVPLDSHIYTQQLRHSTDLHRVLVLYDAFHALSPTLSHVGRQPLFRCHISQGACIGVQMATNAGFSIFVVTLCMLLSYSIIIPTTAHI